MVGVIANGRPRPCAVGSDGPCAVTLLDRPLLGLAIFVTGMHELIGMMLCVVLATGTCIALRTGGYRRGGLTWGLVSLSAVIGLAVVLAAPGNKVRSALVAASIPQQHQNLLHTFKVAGVEAARVLPTWALDVRLLAATLVLVLSPSLVRARAGAVHWGGVSPTLVITSIWLLIVAGMFLGPSVVLHADAGPHPECSLHPVRTWLHRHRRGLRPLACRIGQCNSDLAQIPRRALCLFLVLAILGLSLVLSVNTRDGILGLLKGVPQNWHRMIEWRDEVIRREVQNGATELVFPMRNLAAANRVKWPNLYLFEDITEDPTWYVNQHVARYYRLKTIRRVPPRRVPGTPSAIELNRFAAGKKASPRSRPPQ